MPKLNVIGMVVLCLGVAAGAAALALRAPALKIDGPRVDRLIRRLADTDPDLRREAEQELKDLGRKAEPALKEAAKGADPVIAERARAILGVKPEGRIQDGPAAIPATLETGIRLTLQVTSMPRRPDPVQYYLRLHNGTKRAIALARRLRDGQPEYAGFGEFERIDAEGRLVAIDDFVDPADTDTAPLQIVIVKPGESLDLVPGSGYLSISESGTFRLRFVYNATEGSQYRESLATGHHGGSALPAERFESNEVIVTVY